MVGTSLIGSVAGCLLAMVVVDGLTSSAKVTEGFGVDAGTVRSSGSRVSANEMRRFRRVSNQGGNSGLLYFK